MKRIPLSATALFFAAVAFAPMQGHAIPRHHTHNTDLAEEEAIDVAPFTGKVTRSKVRLRLKPHLDSGVITELDRGMLVAVVGENDDYFEVRPSSDTHAYVYNNYVVDDTIEGARVNVRLGPDLAAPVLTQLNTGDPAAGRQCPTNSRWVEIPVPEDVVFYVAKDFVENIGGLEMIARAEKRESEARQLLESAQTLCESELQKSFEKINIDSGLTTFSRVIDEYDDVPDTVAQAREVRSRIEEAFSQKKIAFLESKVKKADRRGRRHARNQSTKGVATNPAAEEIAEGGVDTLAAESEQQAAAKVSKDTLDEAMAAYRNRLSNLEGKLVNEDVTIVAEEGSSFANTGPSLVEQKHLVLFGDPNRDEAVNRQVSTWEPAERRAFEEWAMGRPGGSFSEFYAEQHSVSVTLEGKVEPYSRPVKNKPGDYIVVDSETSRPIAFIYSTQLNLSDMVGKRVTIAGAPRPNNDFAYPAYYALSIE